MFELSKSSLCLQMRNAENEFYANRRFAIHLIRPSHRRIGTSTSKNHKCNTCMAKADDRDFNLKETKKEYGKESTGLCELLHEAEI